MEIGRNDPCPCGSGKKYKHCHLGKPLEVPLDPVASRNVPIAFGVAAVLAVAFVIGAVWGVDAGIISTGAGLILVAGFFVLRGLPPPGGLDDGRPRGLIRPGAVDSGEKLKVGGRR